MAEEPPPNFGAYVPGSSLPGGYVPAGYGPPANEIFGDTFDPNDPADNWFKPIDYTASDKTIGWIRTAIKNQQPGAIFALGSQFDRAIMLLTDMENSIRAESMRLWNEHWTQSEARAAFMQKGPGSVLAYVADWKEQLKLNREALHGLVDPIQAKQTEMENLYAEYEREVEKAGKPGFLDYFVMGQSKDPGAYSRMQETLADRVDEKREEYTRRARELLNDLADSYSTAFWKAYGGIGVDYPIPNVLMTTPGQPWGGGAPGAPPPPGLGRGAPPPPSAVPPPPPPALNTSQLQRVANQVPTLTNPPTLQNPPGANNLPPAPPGARSLPTPGNPPTAGQAPNLPPLPPGTGALNPRTAPNGLTAPNLGQVPGPGTGVTGPGGNLGALPPPGLGRGITRGVLGRPGSGLGTGALPPPGVAGLGKRGALKREATLRSPAANYTATGAPGVPGVSAGSGMMPPPGVGSSRRQRTPGMPVTRAGGMGTAPQFSQSSMPPPVSPVLGRGQRRQPGQQPTAAQMRAQGAFVPPASAPPVLDATSARAAGNALPPPAGIAPQRARRRVPGDPFSQSGAPGGMPVPPGGFAPGRRAPGQNTSQPAPNLVGNPDWLAETGPDETSSTAPVLRNQMAGNPETGDMPPMVPSQPGATRPVLSRPRDAVRRAMADNRTRPGAQRPASVEAELARRAREADHHGRTSEAPEVRPGEDAAFTVQTPGGPVVGSTPARQEEAPPPAIRNT